MIERDQLELSLEGLVIRRRNFGRRRHARARWWFGQMRQAVEQAQDWPPAPPKRAELAIPLLRLKES